MHALRNNNVIENAVKTMTAQNKKNVYTLIVGLGQTGLSVVRYLSALGEMVIVADSRDIPPSLNVLKQEYPEIEVHTGLFAADVFLNAQRIIVSPGVPLVTPVLQLAKNKGIEISGDIDLFAHEVTSPVIGITGSNGKSTVTSLLAQMANDAGVDAVAAGNIGLPVLDLVKDEIVSDGVTNSEQNEKELYVLELSSFQLETLNHLPMKVAVVLNISADHLDRYADLNAYAYSKQVIYENAESWVVNLDDELAMPAKTEAKNIIGFTLGVPTSNQFGIAIVDGERWICFGESALIVVQNVKLKGEHNLQNALAALALGDSFHLPLASMIETLKVFPGLAHRTQWVGESEGVNWINDSKATNVGAAVAAIKGLLTDGSASKQVLIAGGEAKGANFSDLANAIHQHCRAVILFGKDATLIEQSIEQSLQQLNDYSKVIVKRVVDMKAAVYAANELAQTGDTVLLAPACASFDMFKNFEHRGDVFSELVKQLISESVSLSLSSEDV